MPPSSSSAPRRATSACSDGARPGSGRPKDPCPTRWCRWRPRAGFRWMATDELILARTLDTTFSRDGQGHIEQPERPVPAVHASAQTARAWHVPFRDHALSDLIGFTYAGWPADAAADDFVQHACRTLEPRYAQRTGGEDALITIILDGENAWEHFEGGGRPFLRALYRRLSTQPELRTVTSATPARPLVSCSRASSRALGSTRTSTSGSATLTTSGRGTSWPMPARRSTPSRAWTRPRLNVRARKS